MKAKGRIALEIIKTIIQVLPDLFKRRKRRRKKNKDSD